MFNLSKRYLHNISSIILCTLTLVSFNHCGKFNSQKNQLQTCEGPCAAKSGDSSIQSRMPLPSSLGNTDLQSQANTSELASDELMRKEITELYQYYYKRAATENEIIARVKLWKNLGYLELNSKMVSSARDNDLKNLQVWNTAKSVMSHLEKIGATVPNWLKNYLEMGPNRCDNGFMKFPDSTNSICEGGSYCYIHYRSDGDGGVNARPFGWPEGYGIQCMVGYKQLNQNSDYRDIESIQKCAKNLNYYASSYNTPCKGGYSCWAEYPVANALEGSKYGWPGWYVQCGIGETQL